MNTSINGPGKGARRVGLLGGSFNPAHAGHRHISLLALHHLRLDEVLWMVSPQNPLKEESGMAPLAERLKTARAVAGHGRIRVTDIERHLGTVYTVDTLRELKRRFPGVRFVWIMGADNLIEMPRWKDWRSIFRMVAIAVFARRPYSLRAWSCSAARLFARFRIQEARAGDLARKPPPAWVFLHLRLHAASATHIRTRRAHEDSARANENLLGRVDHTPKNQDSSGRG